MPRRDFRILKFINLQELCVHCQTAPVVHAYEKKYQQVEHGSYTPSPDNGAVFVIIFRTTATSDTRFSVDGILPIGTRTFERQSCMLAATMPMTMHFAARGRGPSNGGGGTCRGHRAHLDRVCVPRRRELLPPIVQ